MNGRNRMLTNAMGMAVAYPPPELSALPPWLVCSAVFRSSCSAASISGRFSMPNAVTSSHTASALITTD
ncbi:hypothetical protein D3C84_1222190 [compost metagenome]